MSGRMGTLVRTGGKMESELENLIHRLDISIRNDWGVTRDERQRMRALIWECRDAIKEANNQLKSVSEVPILPDAGDGSERG
jgi:hypothetical protein